MNLPEEDLPVYKMLFETEYSLEVVKERLSKVIKDFKQSVEKLQNCEFKVLDNITAEKLLIWLKFNFTHLQEETDELNDYYNQEEYEIDSNLLGDFKNNKKEYEKHKKLKELKENTTYECNRHLYAIKVKTDKHIPKILEKLSFPDEYNKFKKALLDMIEYKKETGKKVFYKGNLSKQFLKWYNN